MHLIIGLLIVLLGNPHALLPAAAQTPPESKEEKAIASRGPTSEAEEDTSTQLFIHSLLEKIDTNDLSSVIEPLVKNSELIITSERGDILPLPKKEFLIKYIKDGSSLVFKSRPGLRPGISMKEIIKNVAWNINNEIAFNKQGAPGIDIYTYNDRKMKLSKTINEVTGDIPISGVTPYSMVWNATGTILALAQHQSIQFWQKNNLHWEKGQTLESASASDPNDKLIGLSFSPDDTFFAIAQNYTITLWQRNLKSNIWEPSGSISLSNKPVSKRFDTVYYYGYQLAWSPDSSTFTILSPDSTIYICRKTATTFSIVKTIPALNPIESKHIATALVQRGLITWSPDGKTFAFSEPKEGLFNIIFIKASGFTESKKPVPTTLLADPHIRQLLTWSPDGKMLALYSVDANTNGITRVLNINDNSWINIATNKHVIKDLKWSPDSNILYAIKSEPTADSLISYRIKSLPHLDKCSVNQLLILILLQHLIETPAGQKKITENLPLLKTAFASFPIEIQPALLDRFAWYTLPGKTPVTPPPPVTAVTGTPAIKQGLKNLAHDLNYLSRTLRA